MGHGNFLNSTGRHEHFLKFDRATSPSSRAPCLVSIYLKVYGYQPDNMRGKKTHRETLQGLNIHIEIRDINVVFDKELIGSVEIGTHKHIGNHTDCLVRSPEFVPYPPPHVVPLGQQGYL